MSLLLNVTSYKETLPAYPMQHTLSVGALSIGRTDSCDWKLSDPDKFLSGLHAVIEYTTSGFVLTDHSSNGVYMNDDEEAVGKGNTIMLNDGDQIYLGEYSIRATITENTRQSRFSSDVLPENNFSEMHDPFADLAANPVNEILEEDEGGDLTAWDNELINNRPTLEIKVDKVTPATPEIVHSSEQNHEPVLHEAFIPPPVKSESNYVEHPTKPTAKQFTEDGNDILPDDWFTDGDESKEITEHSSTEVTENKIQQDINVRNTHPDKSSTQEFEVPDRVAMLERKDVHDSISSINSENNNTPEPGSLQADKDIATTTQDIVSETPTADQDSFVEQKFSGAEPDDMGTPVIPHPAGSKEALLKPRHKKNRQVPENLENAAALKYFLKSAGVNLTPELASRGPEIFSLIGVLFRTSIDGMREVIIARSKLKNEMRLDATTIRSSGNNPVKFAITTEDALTRMLSTEDKGYMPPVTAIEEVVDDIKAHQLAMLAGMQSAFQTVLERFEPSLLENRLQKEHPIGASIPMHKQAKLWKLFAELYDEIHQEASDDFSRLFGQAFGKAYEQQIWKLKAKTAAKSGGDRS